MKNLTRNSILSFMLEIYGFRAQLQATVSVYVYVRLPLFEILKKPTIDVNLVNDVNFSLLFYFYKKIFNFIVEHGDMRSLV